MSEPEQPICLSCFAFHPFPDQPLCAHCVFEQVREKANTPDIPPPSYSNPLEKLNHG